MFQLGSCYLKIVVLLFSWKAWKFRTYYTIMALFQSVTSLGSMLWYCPSMPWRRDTSPSRFFLVISRDPFFTIPAPWKCFTLEHTSFTVIYSCILTSYFFVFISFPLFTVFLFCPPLLVWIMDDDLCIWTDRSAGRDGWESLSCWSSLLTLPWYMTFSTRTRYLCGTFSEIWVLVHLSEFHFEPLSIFLSRYVVFTSVEHADTYVISALTAVRRMVQEFILLSFRYACGSMATSWMIWWINLLKSTHQSIN